jgi:hypothetical protein
LPGGKVPPRTRACCWAPIRTQFYRPGEGAGDHTYDEYYELKGFGARAQNAGSPGGHLVREGIISAPFVAPAQALEASAE